MKQKPFRSLKQTVKSAPLNGLELFNVRRALGYSQEEFGKILGVSRSTIARAEADEQSPISRILRLSYDQAARDGKLREKKR